MDVMQRAPDAEWSEVAAALAPGLLRLALMLTGSTPDAEDLLQTTFEKAERHGDRIAVMASPGAYLRRVMVNAHLKQGRRRRLRTVPLGELDPATSQPPSSEDHDLWAGLAALPRQQRAALVLRYYQDLPDPEIAGLIGCSPATVRSHVSRGLAALRATLERGESS